MRNDDYMVVFGKPQGTVLEPLLFLLYKSNLSMILEYTLVSYADDKTLLAEVRKPSNRVSAVSSLNCDLARIGDRCKRWGMLVNPIKTKALVISRSRSIAHIFPKHVIEWNCGGKSDRV